VTIDGSLEYRSNGARNQKAEIRKWKAEIRNQKPVSSLLSTCNGWASGLKLVVIPSEARNLAPIFRPRSAPRRARFLTLDYRIGMTSHGFWVSISRRAGVSGF